MDDLILNFEHLGESPHQRLTYMKNFTEDVLISNMVNEQIVEKFTNFNKYIIKNVSLDPTLYEDNQTIKHLMSEIQKYYYKSFHGNTINTVVQSLNMYTLMLLAIDINGL
jgi:hypothetical protein